MTLPIDDHLSKEWFKRCKFVSDRGIDHIDTLGIRALEKEFNAFYDEGKHTVSYYTTNYEPNPFRAQYDLLVHCWIKFYDLLKAEIAILKKEKKFDLAEEVELTQKLYGISREDFLFAAAELRWPTTIKPNGARVGKFVRDPWSEKRMIDYSHPTIKYTASFGGGGQGKTTTFSVFSIMMFDHFLLTEKGARCMISTTAEDKLDGVSWPYIINLYQSTEKGISLYAGKGIIKGKHTIQRPNNRDTAGVFKGLLLGSNIKDNSVQDKLTGSHGHPFIAYGLDEAQSTSKAPMVAANNFTLHVRDYRINLAGNYGEDEDTLGSNTRPLGGWGSVDENTEYWETKTETGQPIIVRHFNNNNSPGMDKEILKVFPHMPSEAQLNQKYPSILSRSMNNPGYRRFWVGFRNEQIENNLVLSSDFISENKADQPLVVKNQRPFFSFDSAQAELDRNVMLICKAGVCPETNQEIFGPSHFILLKKSTESKRYYRESSAEIIKHINRNGIKSGDGILDWTGRPGHAEHLDQAGFTVERLVYNQGLPDGRRIDAITKRREPPIRLGITVDFQNDVPADRICAHHVAETRIDFAAFLLRQYIQAGRCRGINDNLFKNIINERPLEEELYKRKFYFKSSSKHGDRFKLHSKEEFKRRFGFSPDIFDTLLQMAYFAFVKLRIPLTHINSSVNSKLSEPPKIEKDLIEIQEQLNKFEEYETPMEVYFEGRQEEEDNYWDIF